MNRRQFVSTATGAAAVVRIPDVLAATAKKYDLIVKGGRVIDPSRKLDAIRDVAIAQRPHRGDRGQHLGRRRRNDRRARQVGGARVDRYPHPRGARQGRAGAVPRRRRDGVDRCGIAGRGSHRRNDCGRQVGAATVPRSDQHRARRYPAGRRHHGPQPRRCRRRARSHRAATAR